MKKTIKSISLILLLSSCSIDKLAVKKTSGIIERGIPSIYSEANLDYVKNSLPANLKLMEILYQTEKDPALVKNMTMGFCGYAFAFYEDMKNERNDFYERGIKYSNEYINDKKLKEKKNLSDTDFDILFWNMFCKSSYIDSNRDDLNALSYLGEIEEISQKLYSIKPDYFYNSIETIIASIYASKPRIVGGSPKKAKEHFEKAVNGKGKDFLMNKYFYAKVYATLTMDEELFDKLINEIETADLTDPSVSFFNQIAKLKSNKLKEKKNEIF